MRNATFLACVCLLLGSTVISLPLAAASNLVWIDQFGTNVADVGYDVSDDGLGNVYLTGFTRGNLSGTNAGIYDAFLRKYDASGNVLWTEQLGTTDEDYGYGASADGLGNVYISGRTRGNLEGTNAGLDDAFVSKYDDGGNLLWTKQLGTSSYDSSTCVSADGLGNVYISGSTSGSLDGTPPNYQDAFVSKYDEIGNLLWTKQLDSGSVDSGSSVSADGLGNVYIAGITQGDLEGSNLGGRDAFVSKLDDSGSFLWTRQFGTSYDDGAYDVSVDILGNVFISGYTKEHLEGTNAGGKDAFVRKLDDDGNFLWTKQFGTSLDETGTNVSIDNLGNVYVSGIANGDSLDGDAFVSKYDSSGMLSWTEQLSTSYNDRSYGVSADGLGNVYLSGFTAGSLEGINAGEEDAFIAKFSDPIPEPSSMLLGMMAGAGALMRRRR